MDSATVHTAAQITGWSVRMLHYLDAAGLVSPPRSPNGYRVYGDREVARLRELRQLLADHDLRPADLQVALRLRSEPGLAHAVDGWLGVNTLDVAAATAQPDPGISAAGEDRGADVGTTMPAGSDSSISWLRFEQDKHSRALGFHRARERGPTSPDSHLHSDTTPTKETA
ncbi:MAG: MerR family transcriptional regulator [Actinomycetota bacterium]|nr:MerR family transcriptional regulator [Geodermatophilaceae bacterium]MDQ3505867.1 MerR family transcriptional regulator [Actinomycetota bacterium]